MQKSPTSDDPEAWGNMYTDCMWTPDLGIVETHLRTEAATALRSTKPICTKLSPSQLSKTLQ
jgi:hypothetical protein